MKDLEEAGKNEVKRIIESLLFCTSFPITLQKISEVLKPRFAIKNPEIECLVKELSKEYEEQNRAFRLVEIAKGYALKTCEEFSPFIRALLKTSKPEKLSQAATETLAIIAYRQPITRPEIDEIRGVDSSGIVSGLVERQLIESVGKLEVPGRPALYSVTHHFLRYFGLKDLKSLPGIEN